MSINVRQLDNVVIVDIGFSKLDIFAVKLLRKTLQDLIRSRIFNIHINFSMVRSIDSSALTSLVFVQEICLKKGGELVIFAPDSEIQSIFYIVQLDKYISIYNSETDSLHHRNMMVKRRFKVM
jgi:anti-anti-sigma factor